jgi:PAS domain S-box-containing protein
MVVNYNLKKFDLAVLNREATWWEMELPSGNVFFGDVKTELLGYDSEKFNHYQDFTSLIHPDDYERVMQDMRDHLSGKNKLYETIYRIKAKDGNYITFYDCGKIINKTDEKTELIGFVWKVKEGSDIKEQMKDFREVILQGKPSLVDLFAKIKS